MFPDDGSSALNCPPVPKQAICNVGARLDAATLSEAERGSD